MSALLDQFVEEASDLIEASGAALLILERTPADERAINDLFRSVHTLKGTSALFDFPALTKLVHAGEDVLDGVREGTIPVSGELVDVQLEMLDLLRVWVEAIHNHGRLPDDAPGLSQTLVVRLAATKPSVGAAGTAALLDANPIAFTSCDWLGALTETDRMAAFRAVVDDGLALLAIDFGPDTECYFRGEDPLATCRSLPDMLALAIETVGADPPLADFDPYVCRLRFRALSTAPRAELDHLFRYVSDQVMLLDITPEQLIVPAGGAGVDDACRSFTETCFPLIVDGRFGELGEHAATLLGSIDGTLRSASALRWIVAVLESGVHNADWLTRLTRAVSGDRLDWNISAAGTHDVAISAVAAGDLVDRIVAEQRQILALVTDDPAVLAGRIASVGRALANVAASHGAREAVLELTSATSRALVAGDVAQLIAAVATWFESGRAVADAPGEPEHAATAAAAPGARNGAGAEGAKAENRDGHAPRMLKVDQAKVDRLMALIGELVVAKNALPFLARRAEAVHGSREMSREISQRYSVIDRLAQEMQEAIMEVRLLPVSEVFQRFPRLIRDVSRKLDKQIELVLEGEETQADKNMIELLGDPLIHIVRNSADHGIELPAVRIAAGKPAHGTIRLRAMQEGDRVVIEVSDDGRGVDTQRVIAKALDRGLIDPEQAERMTPAEAAQLIFHPGLSTADVVSDLSGRGVGMDVVQTSIRDAGGSVSVTSQAGLGTTVRLALPLSMAVMRVMTIETAGALYGVPIDMIAETVRIESSAIRTIKQTEAFLLRDTIVPLVRLRRILHVPGRSEEREAVLVLRTAAGLVGMIVDRFDEHMDIIRKPLEGILVGLRGFAGTALLGDGRVLMVLDVKELL
jgi:two-component system chemotaxis sensor kinase CheA